MAKLQDRHRITLLAPDDKIFGIFQHIKANYRQVFEEPRHGAITRRGKLTSLTLHFTQETSFERAAALSDEISASLGNAGIPIRPDLDLSRTKNDKALLTRRLEAP